MTIENCAYCRRTGKDPNTTIISGYKPCPTCGGWGQVVRSTHDLSTKKKQPKKAVIDKRELFIVHGRDRLPALELKVLLEDKYPVKAILLEKEAHGGKTLLEKLEEYSHVDYAFIILTPDDVGALKGEPLRERSRQNVIFEWGLFLGKIERKNVCILIRGDVEIPSDLHGIGHYRFQDSVEEGFLGIDTELRKAKVI